MRPVQSLTAMLANNSYCTKSSQHVFQVDQILSFPKMQISYIKKKLVILHENYFKFRLHF